MRLWIAIVAGLSLGQAQDVEPLPPEDPSVTDPAAAALQDANEQAASDEDGARPPEGYGYLAPSDPTEGSYSDPVPLLPDGDAPVTSGQVAVQQSQTYVPPPVPTVFEPQPAPDEAADSENQAPSGTGGAGSASTPAPYGTGAEPPSAGGGTAAGPSDTGATGAPTPTAPTNAAPGFGGTVDTGATGGSGTAGTTGTSTPPPESSTSPSAGTTAPVQGATPAATNPDQTAQAAPTQTEQGQATTVPPQGQPQPPAEELERLRQRVADLEQDVADRDALATERTQAVQSQVDTHEQRAYDTERARQQRLARIQSGGQWMLAADQALEEGELSVDNALSIADQDFSVVRSSASAEGQGTVVVHSDRIRAQIALARDAAGRRDVYAARIALQNAGDELRLARGANLERPSTSNTLLNP